jgi:hypothetical protein
MITDSKLAKKIVAKRVAQELQDGQLVNLGIGLPTLVANYVPEEINVTFQSENGMVGMGALKSEGEEDLDIPDTLMDENEEKEYREDLMEEAEALDLDYDYYAEEDEDMVGEGE